MQNNLKRKKRRKGCLKERFIKNKRPLNPTHISPKKEKRLETRTIRRAVLMSQSDDDENKKIMQKRQRRQEGTAMRDNIDPQQVAELMKKQQQHHQKQKGNLYLLNIIQDYQFLPSWSTRGQMGTSIRDGPRRIYSFEFSNQQKSKYKILNEIHQKYNNLFHHH